MFEYLPEAEGVSAECREKPDKKPLLVKLAVFRAIAALVILAALLFFRVISPQGAEKVSEEFGDSTDSQTAADKLISEAAEWFMVFIERLPSESGD